MSGEARPSPAGDTLTAESRLAAIVDSSFDAIVSKNLDGIITSWNPAAELLFGYASEEVIGQPILILIPETHLHEEELIISRIRAGERVETFETVRRRKDGSLVPVSLTISPIRDQSGRIVGASKIARDISEAHENERRIRLLLREVHHRVKNNLQTVAALVRLQPMPEEAKRELGGRILAMAAVHEHLHRPGSNGLVDLADYLVGLCRSVNQSFGDRIRLDCETEPTEVEADLATSLGLITNEFIFNTNKYAFREGEAGAFTLELRKTGPSTATLRLANDGVPFDAGPRSEGVGIRLVRGLAGGINSSFEFDGSRGLHFSISFPIGPAMQSPSR